MLLSEQVLGSSYFGGSLIILRNDASDIGTRAVVEQEFEYGKNSVFFFGKHILLLKETMLSLRGNALQLSELQTKVFKMIFCSNL